MKRFIKRYGSLIIAILLTALSAFIAGWYGNRAIVSSSMADAQPQLVRISDPSLPLISPLVSVGLPNAPGFPELSRVKGDVTRIIARAEADGTASDVGVYFRLPSNVHWFGINENDMFDPGSLIKVPVMITYFKEAEANPAILDQTFTYKPGATDPVPHPLPAQLPAGTYSASRLIEAMIRDSDNEAKDLLLDHANQSDLQDVFDEMSINFLKDPSGQISPKQYIVFFNRLYNATFLDRERSNDALKLLTETTFTDGLVAGLPAGTTAAHKYGERGIYEDNVAVGVQLHDCGIIYAPGEPYYLCVMTKGKDVGALADLIKNISAAVWADRASFKPASS